MKNVSQAVLHDLLLQTLIRKDNRVCSYLVTVYYAIGWYGNWLLFIFHVIYS